MGTYRLLPIRQAGLRRLSGRACFANRSAYGAVAAAEVRTAWARALRVVAHGTCTPLRRALLLALTVCCAAIFGPCADAAQPAIAPGSVVVIPVAGAISPATADFIVRGLARAAEDHAQLAVLQLDTPGGLDTSMRQIIKAILASPVPVATYIAPGGARAASAGTYITYASHIAAMAPGTNLGAASPVQLGIGGQDAPRPGQPPALPGAAPSSSPSSSPAARDNAASGALALDSQSTELRKQLHDAQAYIRGLAQLRGRNVEWAERAVREAVSLSARDALEQKVVDIIARDLPDLLRQLDGRTYDTAAGAQHLTTAHAPVVTLEADWRNHFLAVITDPNVALILLMIGMYGLFFEFANPGFVLPGVAGAISLLLGLFALQLLPVNYVGLGLIFLGLAFLIAEAFLPTFGALGFGGIVAFAIGALMLIDTDVPGYGIPLPMIAAVVVFSVLFIFGVSSLVLRSRRRPVVTGAEAMIGSVGVVLDDGLVAADADSMESRAEVRSDSLLHGEPERVGWARVHGERWRVCSNAPLAAGNAVRVTGRRGLMLTVVPANPASSQGERT
ncbi:nodulation protein NfeD [Paraburkholderia sp. Tr-20389]|uniref:NfeD family protein n=1 Tax=Paraburkholderia sp. Tr-20389 TaxID=2703903 RepID=UPI0019811749|nr:nodulation protein NfeD [Paraburkholderia sp. Tr-20389]MBN3757433.1 nodulation protein NfeD [Paraburkholderia sp. Tr-20389]